MKKIRIGYALSSEEHADRRTDELKDHDKLDASVVKIVRPVVQSFIKRKIYANEQKFVQNI